MIGDVIGDKGRIPELAFINTIGPELAVSKTLKAYLEKATFQISAENVPYTTFQLNPISEQWPRPDQDLNYPTASIIEASTSRHEPHNLNPTPLEETLGQFDCFIGKPGQDPPKTVLWKESELSTQFQLDFWTSTQPEREAIAGALSQLFSPSEDRSGVLLQGPDSYFNREIRFTLMSTRRDDSAATAYPNEWRLRCSVQVESDIVSLRKAILLQPTKPRIDVIDPNDPEE